MRHTWAEATAEGLQDDPNALTKLMYLGGWRSESSARWYIQEAIARRAREFLRARNEALYPSPA